MKQKRSILDSDALPFVNINECGGRQGISQDIRIIDVMNMLYIRITGAIIQTKRLFSNIVPANT